MKRALLRGAGRLEFEDVALDPDGLRDDEVYAETECSAVSVGTEYAAYAGHPPLRGGTSYPRLLGYCNVARVIKRGESVQVVRPGDRILTIQSHQSAFVCRARDVLAVVPDGVPSAPASLTYLAELGLAALQKSGFRPGENVAVLGLGVIGLATVAVGLALGGHVVAIGNDDGRLAKARELGAHLCLRSDGDGLAARIAEATGGVGIDVLVTTANPWAAWRLALELARPQGRIAVLGFPGRTEGPPLFNPLASSLFYAKQLSVFAAGQVPEMDAAPGEIRFTLARNMQLLGRLVQDGRLPLERLVTHTVPWKDLGAIYELAARHDRTLIGAVLDWSVSA